MTFIIGIISSMTKQIASPFFNWTNSFIKVVLFFVYLFNFFFLALNANETSKSVDCQPNSQQQQQSWYGHSLHEQNILQGFLSKKIYIFYKDILKYQKYTIWFWKKKKKIFFWVIKISMLWFTFLNSHLRGKCDKPEQWQWHSMWEL